MEPKKGSLTKLSIYGLGGVAVIVLAGGGLLGGLQLAKSKPAVVKYVKVIVTPTVLPTASPSATLAPVKSGAYVPVVVTAPVTKAVK